MKRIKKVEVFFEIKDETLDDLLDFINNAIAAEESIMKRYTYIGKEYKNPPLSRLKKIKCVLLNYKQILREWKNDNII